MIEDNILSVSKAIFQNRGNWKFVTDEMKDKYFFIFNRYFSKKYPQEAQLFNSKWINKSIGLDLWYHFMSDKPYPNWFWSKSKKEKMNDKNISDSDFGLLMDKFGLNKKEDLIYLIENFPNIVEEELKYYKKIKK
jgi:hypothetical protein